jgi:hypothetical protein
MAHISSDIIRRPIEGDLSGACHFLTIPLEIRDDIYRMLVTTSYCTQITATGTTFEFNLSLDIRLVNKKISGEATRVLLEDNNFITLKVSGLSLQLDNIPTLRMLVGRKVPDPILSIVIDNAVERIPREDTATITLLTTSEGLPTIITALWKLYKAGTNDNMPYSSYGSFYPYYPKDLSISLTFKAPAGRRKALGSLVLQPWDLLYGVGKLSLEGDIGDSMSLHLRKRMLEGPFHQEVAPTLQKYHSLGLESLARKDYNCAQRWWTCFADYWRHLGLLKRDPLLVHGIKNGRNDDWNQLLKEFKEKYYEGKFGIVQAYLHQANYQEALLNTTQVRCETARPLIDIDYTFPALLRGKLHLCEALAHTALGKTKEGINNLSWAAALIACHSEYENHGSKVSFLNLKEAIQKELSNRNWPIQSERSVETVEVRSWETKETVIRSFWEWLEAPELLQYNSGVVQAG